MDRFGIDPRTVAKMLMFSVPPGYRRTRPPARPKLDPFVGIIDQILEADKTRPTKQRHTSKRIFERLRDEHGFTGGLTIVKDYVAGWRQRSAEMFVPLAHPPGHAQADFGEAIGVIGGVERKIHFFAMDLPHSDALLRAGLSGGDDGGVLRRPRSGVRILRRGAAVDPVRQHQDRGGAHPGRRQAAANAGVQRAAIALPVRGPVRPAWQGQRQGQGRGAGRLCAAELPGADAGVRRASRR